MKAKHKPRRTRDESKHEAILKAATRLFLKNGYTNTSMDAIADAACVTKQTVYSHYKNKDTLFSHMLAMLSEKYAPPAALGTGANKPVEELLYEIGHAFLAMLTSYEGMATTRLVISEVQSHPKLAQRYYEDGTLRTISMLAQFLDTQNKRGKLAIADTESAASYFFAMLKGRYFLRMLLAVKPVPSVKEKEAHVKETVQVFMRVYGGSNPLRTKSVT